MSYTPLNSAKDISPTGTVKGDTSRALGRDPCPDPLRLNCGAPKLTGVPENFLTKNSGSQNKSTGQWCKIMFKVIVAGGRDFSNYDLLKSTLDKLFSQKTDIEIVSGMARGADTLAIKYASEKQLPLKKFPADWKLHGNSSGYKRNVLMAGYADACVCFWDGTSKGTAHMIETARKFRLQLRTIKY